MLELSSNEQARTTAQTLQLHYFTSPSRELSGCVPAHFLVRALLLVLYLLPYMKPDREEYVRSKLEIDTPILSHAVREAMLRRVAAEARHAVLEHVLRVVVMLLRDAPTLTARQLEYIGTLLQPLWDHYQSKLVLQQYMLLPNEGHTSCSAEVLPEKACERRGLNNGTSNV